jgi:hypothetical protein
MTDIGLREDIVAKIPRLLDQSPKTDLRAVRVSKRNRK